MVTIFLTAEKSWESPEGAARTLFCVAQDLSYSASRPRLVNQNLSFVQWLVGYTVIGSEERSGVMGNTSDVFASAAIVSW